MNPDIFRLFIGLLLFSLLSTYVNIMAKRSNVIKMISLLFGTFTYIMAFIMMLLIVKGIK